MCGRVEPSLELDLIVRRTIGAAIEVHQYLGPGYLESVYEEALALELKMRSIRFQRQVEIDVRYKSRKIGRNRLDLLVENRLLVELKAVECLAPVHKAQVISYLKATNLQLGLLINFNHETLKQGIRRIIYAK